MAKAVKEYKHYEVPKEAGTYHKLVCLTGDNKGIAYFILGKRLVLGRSEQCDITILDLKSSREHAEIIAVDNSFILTDLGSQNGIIVNDLKIKQHALYDVDKVIVGKTVYKFSKQIVVDSKDQKKRKTRENTKIDKYDEDDLADEKEPQNPKLTKILIAVFIIAVVILFGSDSPKEKETKEKKKLIGANVNEIDGSFQKAIAKRRKDSKANKEKLALYFKRGLREFREGNYFRAINEFENAQQWSPNDPLANFYLRKTREKLEEQIESYFSKAIRDTDAINYLKASTSYCSIIRLLNRYKNDQRYKSAVEGIRSIEKKLGLDEGEINCIEKEEEK
jgi:pSer/pThr/pTyr-binding forkhead associated (FHA) protein